MENNLSPQEEFWKGKFGDDYIDRNNDLELLSSNLAFFSKIIDTVDNEIISICEFGANIGLNLETLKRLLPSASTCGIEINQKAYEELSKNNFVDKAFNNSIFDVDINNMSFNLTFTKGVLIHINPSLLEKTYEILYSHSNRYILLAEYYNPSPVEIDYRGFEGKLFKRDFAGEMLTKYSDLKLRSYGFAYKRDKNFPQDDITWFLMEKIK